MGDKVAEIIDGLIGREGRYANHPNDPGGETMWGITARVARENNYIGAMRDMPRETAERIYRSVYWEQTCFDKVFKLAPLVAEELLDTGVNIGVALPARWLQQWLNTLNDLGAHYPDIAVDGKIGPATINALRSLIAKRGLDLAQSVLLKGLNADQAVRYKDLCNGNVKFESFMFGWLRTRVGMPA